MGIFEKIYEQTRAVLDFYEKFTLYQEEEPKFEEKFRFKDIPVVQLYNAPTRETDNSSCRFEISYCGSFSWRNNKIISLDGKKYNPEMIVYGHTWVKFDKDDQNGMLMIIVGDDWKSTEE